MTATQLDLAPNLIVRLEIETDAVSDLPVFGICANGFFVSDLSVSECGRFKVDPLQAYGVSASWADALTELNNLLVVATENALDAGCGAIQARLGVAHGDFAAAFFSNNDNKRALCASLATYLLEQLRHQLAH